ncbi:MAG: hypothetical protein HOK52_15235 [Candidatus Marinimicrobia bacterium]|jgi:hypothetical protein|nr:hypothetical protein [Candidatus Neomarinimicrobiota bacterium]MBT3937357.1 hypothetical protein [Candidatus Neomarinimicrobiota bacterium]MBT3960969.1 hypothetical protein [Candidatus Neomarinimicrobiota bacterium]MBT4382313.1 hypothetical protein [Candidatus Neomarinimicrobiota bacterium]MBT4636944.1 hypothetical protein [Candidatus Neomarinimicrobiota bacterium]
MHFKNIHEPTTTITDFILALMGFAFGISLLSVYQEKQFAFHFYWGWGFIVSGLGAFVGAISHGIGPNLNVKINHIIWKVTVFLIGVSGWYFSIGASIFFFPPATYEWVRWIIIISLVFYSLWLFKDDRFIVVILYYIPLMIFIMTGMFYHFLVLNSAGSAAVAVGILVSLGGAGIQASGFSIHKYFNHNDLFHVIQMIGYLLMFQGGMEIGIYGV